MSGLITVVLADDHTLIRESLARWFESSPEIRVVAHVDDADEAVAAALHHRPDVTVLDIDMPGRDCFDAAQTICRALPQTRIIFLSGLVHDCYIERALAVRAAGYVSKGTPLEMLAAAIRGAKAGQVHFSPEVQARIVVDARGPRLRGRVQSRSQTLSTRELEVLRHLARGLTRKEIARQMCLSPDTVHAHTSNLMRKLEVHSRVELATFAVREGLTKI
jgi:DNA-binding NarL/FixJ family response regulator